MSIENIQKTDAECGTIAGMDELQDAVTLAAELTPIWRHECPFVGTQVDEYDERILECRCFEGPRFLGMQDSIAVAADARRHAEDK